MRNKRFIFIILIFFLTWSSQSYALKEDTHKAINEYIATHAINGFFLETYLKNTLGYQNGFNEYLKGEDVDGNDASKQVFWWLAYGGIQEDRPGDFLDYATNTPTRSVNHFHNPLKPWSEAGLNDTVAGALYTGESSILWAQDSNQVVGGQWSWQTVRSTFYLALITPVQSIREKYFAKTFRALGQQMHLVQDASVPEHVRNSAHAAKAYEGFVLDFMQNTVAYGELWNNLLLNPITFDQSLLSVSSNPSAPVPISKIIDADVYTGDNPGITQTLYNSPQLVGLAEYTNANFLSKDTIFTNDALHNFPYPKISDTTLWADTNKKTYLRKVGSGDVVNHLVLQSRLWLFIQTYSPLSIDKVPKGLDEECYKEYAQNLIPRAVGYSAGLLNYFFRGTLEITPPAQNVYAVTDGSQTPYTDAYGNHHQQFTSIKANVRNTTPNDEQIGAGTLHAVAKYKKRIDYQPDLSTDPTDEHPEWGVSEDDFSYSVSAPKTIASLSSTEPTEFAFDFTAIPIPAGITDLYLQVVFNGTLGNEADNAIAVGMKDLAEPAHHVFWNLSDQFSLLYTESTDTTTRYHLYTAEQIMADTVPNGKASKVDLNHNGIFNEPGEPYISPYPMTFEITYLNETNPASPPQPSARVVDLPAGRYMRLIIIQDRDQPRIVRFTYTDQINPAVVGVSEQTYPAVLNQTEPDGYFYYMPVGTFRHSGSGDSISPIRHHFYTGILSCLPSATGGGTSYCPYEESESIPAELSPYGPVEILFDNQ